MEKIYLLIIAGFLLSILLTPLFIPLLRKLKFGQQIRGEGPKRHMDKSGTPTMGGVTFLLSGTIALIALAPSNTNVWVLIIITILTGIIGFVDDYLKVVLKRSLGLRARHKVIAQLIIVTGLFWYLTQINHPTDVLIPFTQITIELGMLYYLLLIFMVLGTSNAVNITDGLDGLATGIVVIAFTAYVVVAHMGDMVGVASFSSALIGACAGFLIYNLHPAKIFMGDVGSLALGSALAVMAILTKTELLLLIIGLPLVIETVSVICQVIYYQLTGSRILLMSPLHHHFELAGWSEWRVVIIFWLVSLLCAVLGIIALNPMIY